MSTLLGSHGSHIGLPEFSVACCTLQGELAVNVQNSLLMIYYYVGITCCLSSAETFFWMEPNTWLLHWAFP